MSEISSLTKRGKSEISNQIRKIMNVVALIDMIQILVLFQGIGQIRCPSNMSEVYQSWYQ